MEFKAYLNQKYQGYDSFIENIIYPIFGEDRYNTAYNGEVLNQIPELRPLAERSGISSVIYCGDIDLEDNPVRLFDITVKDKVMMERNRVAVQTVVKRAMETYSGAFMLIHYDQSDKWDWRFTFCQLKDKGEYTDSKRYTFLLGPNQACTTAAQNFIKLAAKGGDIEIGDIVKAFDVEALSDEFFGKYKTHYEAFVEYITGKRYEGKDEKVIHDPHPFFSSLFGGDDKAVRDYVKLLLGRITFLHFLQKKGWLGVPENCEWGSGDEQFMLNLFVNASPELKDDFVVSVLNPLFFDALDCDRTGKKDVFDSKVFGRIRVPYLNGGMFEKADKDAVAVKWPAEYFGKLFRFFSEYNFTIDENDPNEAQVGVDPEMLGKIFENLLEDNKDKGAFYTPKTIVKYMCQESLIAYLMTKTGYDEKLIRDFVHSPEEGKAAFNEDQQYAILDAILKVKICDPAIGSGAFPIGLLNELVWCKEAIYGDKKGRADIKREIIRDNIYGVDIEKGAVDIARLRFWLSLVVDEEEPSPLPNLDYKIMQGNSLLEWYNGIDLTELVSSNGQDLMLNNEHADKQKLKLSQLLKNYFGESDHVQKAALKQQISSIIRELLGNAGIVIPEDMDVAENNLFFLWHTWFNNVFAQGGFDICIGNPPYLATRSGLISAYNKAAYKKLFRTAEGQFDLYGLFIEQGLNLLKSSGIEVLITESTFVNNKNFKKLREILITENTYNQLIYLGENVFESANVDVTISVVVKKKTLNHNIVICRSYNDFQERIFDTISQSLYNEPEFEYEINVRATENDLALFKNARSKTKFSIGDIAELPRGAEFGSDAAFITNVPIVGYDKLVVGKDIKKYSLRFNDRYLPFDENDISVFKEKRYYLEPKILIQRIRNLTLNDRIVSTYDEEGYVCTNTLRLLFLKDDFKGKFDLKFILGVLNSRLINRFFLKLFLNKDIYKYQLERIPIPDVSTMRQSSIIALVDNILTAKKKNQNADTSNWEAEIDRLVYDLYGVPEEERK